MSEHIRHHTEESTAEQPPLQMLAILASATLLPPHPTAGDNSECSTHLMSSVVLHLLDNAMESATW